MDQHRARIRIFLSRALDELLNRGAEHICHELPIEHVARVAVKQHGEKVEDA